MKQTNSVFKNLALFLLVGSSCAFATEIGVIDVEELNKASQVEDANKRLEKEFASKKEEFETKHKSWGEKKQKLQRDKDILSATDKKNLEKEASKLEENLQQLDEKYRSEYTARYREEMDKFQKTLKEVVANILKSEKLDLVLPNQAVVQYTPKVDITAKVLEALNKQVKTPHAEVAPEKK